MPSTFDLGDSVRLTFTVRDIAGALVDATTAIVVTKPDGTPSSPTITHPGTGTYYATVSPDLPGEWTYRWTAIGTATTAEDGAFLVEPNLAGTLYTTVGEVRDQLGDAVTQALDPGQLEAAIRAASRAVDRHCGRRFWLDPAPVARPVRPDAANWTFLKDVGTRTGLVVKVDSVGDGTFATTWTSGTHFQLEPFDADADGGAYSWTKLCALAGGIFPQLWDGRPALQVTARWGWSQVPDQVRTAATLKAVGLWRRKDAPFGIAGVNDFGPVRIGGREDGDVARLLEPFVLLGGVA